MLAAETTLWARKMGMDRTDAEDFTQGLIESSCQPHVENSVNYFRRIRRHRFNGFMAKKRRREARFAQAKDRDFDHELVIDGMADVGAEDELEAVLAESTWQRFAEPEDLELMHRFDDCGGDGKQFASALHISRPAARQRLLRCRSRLKDVIRHYGDGDLSEPEQ